MIGQHASQSKVRLKKGHFDCSDYDYILDSGRSSCIHQTPGGYLKNSDCRSLDKYFVCGADQNAAFNTIPKGIYRLINYHDVVF